ncbi:hypothetical protein T4E_12171, partial [Trichinella pseudospiralis]
LICVASGSIVQRFLNSSTALNADDMKQTADDTKQNCGMKIYGICGSPRVPI